MHNDFSYAVQTDEYRATEGMTPCTFFERSRRGTTSLRGLSRPNGAKMKKTVIKITPSKTTADSATR